MASKKWNIILVMGGPGAGKGTQCGMLALEFKTCHVNIDSVLRAEIEKPGSIYADIKANISEGRSGPPELTVKILKEAMTAKSEKHGVSTFLVDGFPRKLDQAECFESEIGVPSAVFFLDCPKDDVQGRFFRRAKASGYFDEDAGTMQQRFKTYAEKTMPVVEHYRVHGRLIHIDASGDVLKVYNEIKKHWTGLSKASEASKD